MESRLRTVLAACYRLFDWLGWTELIFNHITVRLPSRSGQKAEYLINPFGLHYAEVRPENLVRIDVEGNDQDGGGARVNRAGFVIHSAIHAARDDAHCAYSTRWRTRFHADGGQCSTMMADTVPR